MPILRLANQKIYVDGEFRASFSDYEMLRPEITLPTQPVVTYDGENCIVHENGMQSVIAGSWDDGDFIVSDDEIVQDIILYYAEPLPTAQEAYDDKVKEITTKANTVVSQGPLSKYPVAEQLIFKDQEAEAIAWNADNSASTPTLDDIVTASGGAILKSDLVTKILANAGVMRNLSASITSQRTLLTRGLNTIKTDVDAGNEPVTSIINYTVAYTLPGYSLQEK